MTIENPSPAAPPTPLLVQLAGLHTRILSQHAREYDWAQVQVHLPLAVDWPGEVRRAHAYTSERDGGVWSLVVAAALHRSPAIVRDWLLELAAERGAWYRGLTEATCGAIETMIPIVHGLGSTNPVACGATIAVDAMRRAQRLWALLSGPAAEHARWLAVRCACEASALEAEPGLLERGSDTYHLVDAVRPVAVAASSVASALGALALGAAPRSVILDVADACYQLAWFGYNIELASAAPGQVVPDSLLRAAVERERRQVARLAEMIGGAP
jgi:hypothetical protein